MARLIKGSIAMIEVFGRKLLLPGLMDKCGELRGSKWDKLALFCKVELDKGLVTVL